MDAWVLANLVLAAHIALFIVLALGAAAAALGWMRRHLWVAIVYWPTLLVTLALQLVPGCGLTNLERWLRWKQDPDWDREISLLRTVFETVTRLPPPAVLDYVFPTAVAVLGIYGFARCHARDLVAFLRRRVRGLNAA